MLHAIPSSDLHISLHLSSLSGHPSSSSFLLSCGSALPVSFFSACCYSPPFNFSGFACSSFVSCLGACAQNQHFKPSSPKRRFQISQPSLIHLSKTSLSLSLCLSLSLSLSLFLPLWEAHVAHARGMPKSRTRKLRHNKLSVPKSVQGDWKGGSTDKGRSDYPIGLRILTTRRQWTYGKPLSSRTSSATRQRLAKEWQKDGKNS